MKLRRRYPTSTVCRALGVPRSTAYYRRSTPDEKALKAALVVLAGRWPTYGYRRLTAELRRDGVPISMSRKGEPTENGHVERLMRTIKEEEVALSDYDGYGDAKSQIGTFLDGVYRHKRIHSALGYLTPAEFERRWHEEQNTDLPNNLNRKRVRI